MLALLSGIKPAAMLDYYFASAPRRGAPPGGLPAVAALLRDLAAAAPCAAAAAVREARCAQLGDCVFLLRPSLLQAAVDAPPPLFVRLDAGRVRGCSNARAPPAAALTQRTADDTGASRGGRGGR